MIQFKGKSVQIQELSRRYGIPWTTIRGRYEAGYRDDDLIAERVKPTYFKGERVTLKELAQQHGLPLSLVKGRHAIGLRDDDLVAKGHRNKGSKHAATKLDVEKVKRIKLLLLTSSLTQAEIGKLFNVDQSHISDIRRGKRWAEVEIDVEAALAEEG